jgi:two-component system chemotaxis response regulator CheY
MRISLIVDDSTVVRKVACRIFELLNFEAREAADAEEALELCRSVMPDAILVDGHLRPMSSTEFLSSLRDIETDKRPVVIYCTSENDQGDIARALSAGADDYVLKPFDREEIRSKLNAAGLPA